MWTQPWLSVQAFGVPEEHRWVDVDYLPVGQEGFRVLACPPCPSVRTNSIRYFFFLCEFVILMCSPWYNCMGAMVFWRHVYATWNGPGAFSPMLLCTCILRCYEYDIVLWAYLPVPQNTSMAFCSFLKIFLVNVRGKSYMVGVASTLHSCDSDTSRCRSAFLSSSSLHSTVRWPSFSIDGMH